MVLDISQELFSCRVFPGDPAPKRERISSMAEGALYNLTALSLCAHNGTHADAPFHFLRDGKTIGAVGFLRSTTHYSNNAFHNIVDISEVPLHIAVIEDLDLLSGSQFLRCREVEHIRATGRAINGEEAQTRRRDIVELTVCVS